MVFVKSSIVQFLKMILLYIINVLNSSIFFTIICYAYAKGLYDTPLGSSAPCHI